NRAIDAAGFSGRVPGAYVIRHEFVPGGALVPAEDGRVARVCVDAHWRLGKIDLLGEFQRAGEPEPRRRFPPCPPPARPLALRVKAWIEPPRAAGMPVRSDECYIGARQEADRHVIPYIARRLHPRSFVFEPVEHQITREARLLIRAKRVGNDEFLEGKTL